MKTKGEIKKLWKCPKCGRQFERKGQVHSCKFFPVEQHFKDKPTGKLLYEKFKRAVKKQVGPFKIESLECCIHLVSTFTFAAVLIFTNKIRIDFCLSRKIKNRRIVKSLDLSANRHMSYIDIFNEAEIDDELMEWMREAYDRKSKKANVNIVS